MRYWYLEMLLLRALFLDTSTPLSHLPRGHVCNKLRGRVQLTLLLLQHQEEQRDIVLDDVGQAQNEIHVLHLPYYRLNLSCELSPAIADER